MITRPCNVVGLLRSPHSNLSWNASMASAVEEKLTTKAAAKEGPPLLLKLHHHILLKEDKSLKNVASRIKFYFNTLKPVIVRPSRVTSIATKFLRGLDDLIHQALVLHSQTNRRLSMVPTGVRIILVRTTV